jgi:hypothetical protein
MLGVTMPEKNITKYQHYVPRSYLKHFTYDGSHLFAFKIEERKMWNASIESVGGENYFYDFSASELKEFCSKFDIDIPFDITQNILSSEQPLEKFFSEYIEGQLFNSIKNVISVYTLLRPQAYGTKVFDNGTAYEWALYAYYQYFRTEDARRDLAATERECNKKVIALLEEYQRCGFNAAEEILRFKKRDYDMPIRQTHLELLADTKHMKGMANIFANMYKWIICIAPPGLDFFTTDNPVIFDDYYKFNGSSLFFPISPKLCFMLICKDNETPYSLTTNNSFKQIPTSLYYIINYKILMQARRFVFSKKEVDIIKWLKNAAKIIEELNKTTK